MATMPLYAKNLSALTKSYLFVICNISKDFFSETTPISIRFYVQPSGKGEQKVYVLGPGHMTKMSAMSIYG